MHDSDFFPRTGKDVPSRFWSAYERVAKQHDDEFIERHNGEMDVLLIFVRATFNFASTWGLIEGFRLVCFFVFFFFFKIHLYLLGRRPMQGNTYNRNVL